MKEHDRKLFRTLVADDGSILGLFQQVLSRVETGRPFHLETRETKPKPFQENASSQQLSLFDVVTCQPGDEALDAVKDAIKEDRPFSVAFIDSHIPLGPDGTWTAEQIRAVDSDIEIVIFTDNLGIHPPDLARRVPSINKFNFLYLQKPVHPLEIYQLTSFLSMKWYTACKLKRVKEGLEKVAAVRSLKLKESERHFTNFLENLGDIAYTTDSHGNLTYTNKMAEIITGKPLKDIIGKPFFPLFAKKSHGCISKNLKRGKSPI